MAGHAEKKPRQPSASTVDGLDQLVFPARILALALVDVLPLYPRRQVGDLYVHEQTVLAPECRGGVRQPEDP